MNTMPEPASRVAAGEPAPFEPLWREHAPHAGAALLADEARQAFDILAAGAPDGAAAFALECGLTPGVRPHLYLALQDARARQAAGHGDTAGLLYLRYTFNNAGRASMPLPHRPGPATPAGWPGWLSALCGSGLSDATAAQVESWLSRLPGSAAIDNAAWLDRRPGQPLRLYVSGLSGAVPHGVPRCPPQLPEAAAAPAALAARRVAVVDIDGHGPRPRWGLELLTARHPDGALARWTPLIDTLAAHGLCTPDAARALARWCSHQDRGISHMKLMMEADQVRDARAFLLARRRTA